jgi:hypothetical protein
METLNRRKLIVTGIAGTGALAVAALPTIAASVASDAKLLLLCHQYRRFARMADRLCDVQEVAEQKAWAKKDQPRRQKSAPPRPEALTGELEVWPEACGPFGVICLERKDLRKTLSELAEGSHKLPAILFPRGLVPADVQWVPPPEWARIKARQLLAIHDDWTAKGGGEPKAKRERRSRALVKVEKAFERLHRMEMATAAAIAALPASTMAGVRAKLDLIEADAWSNGKHFGTDYPPLVPVLNSAMQDIARIEATAKLDPLLAA